jgi:hypothetical protein
MSKSERILHEQEVTAVMVFKQAATSKSGHQLSLRLDGSLEIFPPRDYQRWRHDFVRAHETILQISLLKESYCDLTCAAQAMGAIELVDLLSHSRIRKQVALGERSSSGALICGHGVAPGEGAFLQASGRPPISDGVLRLKALTLKIQRAKQICCSRCKDNCSRPLRVFGRILKGEVGAERVTQQHDLWHAEMPSKMLNVLDHDF